MSATDELDLFIGSKSSYEKHKRQNNIVVEEDDEPVKPQPQQQRNTSVLSKETLKPIDDEMMQILKRTRTVHDYSVVYMQSSMEFYDTYYNNEEASEELKAARQIKRVYKVYADYIKGIQARNAYIDTLIEKYGGEEEFQRRYSMGMVQEWIPKLPILSKKCPEYELYLSGHIPTECEPLPEGSLEETLEAMAEMLEGVELETDFGIETRLGLINQYNELMESEYARWGVPSHYDSVSVSDLEELNRVFNSWYKPETGKTEMILFKNAPENIKKRFNEQSAFDKPGLLTRVSNGEPLDEDVIDMNEMVHDEKTGRNMTRKELMNREMIRLMAKGGWSESRLLNYTSTSSRLVNKKRKTRVSKKKKRPSTEFYNDALSCTGADPMYSENDYMSSAFLSLMRGDEE